MINRNSIKGSLLVPLIMILTLISFANMSDAETLSTSEITSYEWSLEDKLEFNSGFELFNNVALQNGKCGDLKSGYCNMGQCENGWECKDNGRGGCFCTPPSE